MWHRRQIRGSWSLRRALDGMGYTYAHHLIDADGSGGFAADCPHTLVFVDGEDPQNKQKKRSSGRSLNGPSDPFVLRPVGFVDRGRPLWDDVVAAAERASHVVFVVFGEDERRRVVGRRESPRRCQCAAIFAVESSLVDEQEVVPTCWQSKQARKMPPPRPKF